MTTLTTLPKTTKRGKKRVGRGYGSGKGGHTAGRGSKGQKSRSKVPLHFGSGAMGASLIKRLPLLRGKGKLKPSKKKPIGVNVKYLNILPAKSVVDIGFLVKHRIVDELEAKRNGVKILGDGELELALTINLPTTAGARKKIEKAGGTVEINKSKDQKSNKSISQVSNETKGEKEKKESKQVSKNNTDKKNK